MNCRFKRPYASLRLICFPGAGSGTSFYTQWGREVTDDIEVHAVCLPGRENRSGESFCSSRKDTVEWIVQSLKADFLDKPFAFFGHSMGAIISFWVAIELKKQCNREPVHMFISSAQPPHAASFKNVVGFSVPDDEFMKRASATLLGALPKDVSENKAMMDVFLPIWKADLLLLRNLCYDHEPGEKPLSCSIDLFCGHGEDLDVVNYLDDWNQLTTGTMSKQFMAGDHYFLNDKTNTKKVQSVIETKLEELD